MKVISFNINGLRARLHQLQAIIDRHSPDVIGLQETKVSDPDFPLEALENMGYHIAFHGQKAHYGVALLSKTAPLDIKKGFPSDTDDSQKRLIMGDYAGADGSRVRIINGYFPQGENRTHETKFPAKRKFYADLMALLNSDHEANESLVIMGDFNISPTDADIGIGEKNAKRWLQTGKCSFLPEEREWYDEVLNWGVKDTYRCINPDTNDRFSWFDYRSRGFDDNPKRGLRIDQILATHSLCEHIKDVGIDYEIRGMEKPSDHCPIWVTFNL